MSVFDYDHKLATNKQVNLLVRLVSERRSDPDAPLQARSWAQWRSIKEVSEQINRLLAEPKPSPATGPSVTPPPAAEVASVTPQPLSVGMYRKPDGQMYRVYPARSGGHLLAKALVPDPSSSSGWAFSYAGAAGRFVTPADRMTLEEAKAWGSNFGTCCVCAALLTDPTSVAAGIGPVCGGRV